MASTSRADYINNINTINTSRYGSEMRTAIAENFDYLKNTAGGGGQFVKCTQEEYDAMQTHDPDTLYIIVEGES